jgi:tetratricopeptide (TPR) repeat protein
VKIRSLLVIALLTSTGAARAQDGSRPDGVAPRADATVEERARTEFAAGQAAYDRQDFPGAIAAFERAYGLYPTPAFLYDLAQAERLAGRCEAALAHYRQFIQTYAHPLPADVDEKMAEVSRCAAKAAVPPPTSAPVAPPSRETPAPARAPTAPPAPSEKAVPEWVGWTLTGVGAASVIAGTVLAAMVVHRQSVVEQECPGKVCQDSSGLQAASEGQKLLAGSIAAYAVGATGLGLGMYFLLHDSGERADSPRTASTLPTGVVWTLTSHY